MDEEKQRILVMGEQEEVCPQMASGKTLKGMLDTCTQISDMCDAIKSMLLEKNRKYGNSALSPVRVFSRADTVEQIRVRMDDKLSRIRNQQSDDDEDVYMDLAGYLVLLLIAMKQKKEEDL